MTFLDVYDVSATRPDDTIGAHFVPPKLEQDDPKQHDCVHWCLPGPPDTFSRLLFNLLPLVLPTADAVPASRQTWETLGPSEVEWALRVSVSPQPLLRLMSWWPAGGPEALNRTTQRMGRSHGRLQRRGPQQTHSDSQ